MKGDFNISSVSLVSGSNASTEQHANSHNYLKACFCVCAKISHKHNYWCLLKYQIMPSEEATATWTKTKRKYSVITMQQSK